MMSSAPWGPRPLSGEKGRPCLKSGENRYLRHASYYWLARPRPDLDALPREVACSLLRGFMHITVWCGEYQSWDASRRSRAPSQHTIVLLAPAGCRVNGCEPDTRCACAGQGPVSNSPLHSSLRWKHCTHGMNQRWESKSGGGGRGGDGCEARSPLPQVAVARAAVRHHAMQQTPTPPHPTPCVCMYTSMICGAWHVRRRRTGRPVRGNDTRTILFGHCQPGKWVEPGCCGRGRAPTTQLPHTMCLYVYKHDMRSVACAEEVYRTPCEEKRHQDHFRERGFRGQPPTT